MSEDINMDGWSTERKREWEKLEKKLVARETSRDWRENIEANLHDSLNKIDNSYSWEPQQHLDDDGDRHSVDVMGTPTSERQKIVYIEVEADRATCVRNVIKVWAPLAKGTLKKQVLFIHVFSPNYQIKREKKKEETIFVGQKAEIDTGGKFKYLFVQLPAWVSSDELASGYIIPLLK